MAEQTTLKAAENPTLANQIAAEAFAEKTEITPAQIVSGQNLEVYLPGGFLTFSGEVLQTAEVKELTGKDEEAIAKTQNVTRIYSTVLQRGVVSLNGSPVTTDILNNMLLGDREALLMGIYRATYGDVAELLGMCTSCGNNETVGINLPQEIKVKPLLNPAEDRVFEVKGRTKTFTVTLPTGVTEHRLLDNTGSAAEKITTFLEQTVLKIDGVNVLSKAQVQDLGMADRRKILEEIALRAPGPQFDDVTVECPKCGGELLVPVSIGAMFRF
jgi:hypothetical protein